VVDLSSLAAAIESRAQEIVEEAAQNAGGRLDRIAPRSGDNIGETLAETQEISEVRQQGTLFSVEIAYTAEYAETTDQGGSDYYWIFPVEAERLVFEGTNDWAGKIIYTSAVFHPPQRGTRWFTDTMKEDIWPSGR
jgi:hypothetical protein